LRGPVRRAPPAGPAGRLPRPRRFEATPQGGARARDDQPALPVRAPQLLRRPHSHTAARPGDTHAPRAPGRFRRSRDPLPQRAPGGAAARTGSTSGRSLIRRRTAGARRQPVEAEPDHLRAAGLRARRSPMRIVVCHPQVPFARGGAEILADNLVEELRRRDHEAELVTVPFKWYPPKNVVTQSLVWRLLDLDEVQGRPVDLLIATKFPSYVVRHPNKVVWLVHQFRQAYDLDRTELREFGEEPFDRAARRAVHRLDRTTLGEAQRLFAISENVATRLEGSIGLKAEVLRPPPQQLSYRCEEYG